VSPDTVREEATAVAVPVGAKFSCVCEEHGLGPCFKGLPRRPTIV
jgi:hypothetical protein